MHTRTRWAIAAQVQGVRTSTMMSGEFAPGGYVDVRAYERPLPQRGRRIGFHAVRKRARAHAKSCGRWKVSSATSHSERGE